MKRLKEERRGGDKNVDRIEEERGNRSIFCVWRVAIGEKSFLQNIANCGNMSNKQRQRNKNVSKWIKKKKRIKNSEWEREKERKKERERERER